MTVIAGRRVSPQNLGAPYEHLTVTPYAGALGAVIERVDLSQELDDAVIAEIRRALIEHLVVFFRGQDFTPEQHLAFARRFGTG